MREGRKARCRITEQMLLEQPSGNLFGLTQNAGMGWEASALGGKQVLILSTHGGVRAPDGTPIALGLSHRALGSGAAGGGSGARIEGTAARFRLRAPVTDPCDGRTQGTPGMFDSLPYRNDAAIVLRRLIRSLPTRARSHWRCDVRQRSAGHDDGAGRNRAICPACWCRAA